MAEVQPHSQHRGQAVRYFGTSDGSHGRLQHLKPYLVRSEQLKGVYVDDVERQVEPADTQSTS